jgi:hypothetical protein
MPSRSRACIYANPSQDFAKLTKMQNPFAKPLDRSFVDFFAKTGIQSSFAKLLEYHGSNNMITILTPLNSINNLWKT